MVPEDDKIGMYNAAVGSARSGNLRSALRIFETLLSQEGTPPSLKANIYVELGKIEQIMERLSEAERRYSLGIYADPLLDRPYSSLMELNSRKVSEKCKFSIVISTYNRCGYLQKCVETLRKNSFFEIEIVLVCDPCEDGTAEYMTVQERDAGDVVAIVNKEHIGSIRSLSKGMLAATGDYVCMLNDDVLVMPGWDLAAYLTVHHDDTAGCAVPLVIYPDGRVQCPGQHNWHRSIAFSWLGSVPFMDTSRIIGNFIRDFPEYQRARECDYGYFPVMKRDCFEQIGVPDRRYKHYYVDLDIGYKIQQLGLRNVYCPTSVLVHHHLSRSNPALIRERFETDKVIFEAKWCLYE